MTTENAIILFLSAFMPGFVGAYFLGRLRLMKKRKLKADFMESFERHEDASHPDLVTYTYTNKSPEEPLTTPPASESSSTGDHDPESYKDLSAGKFERFGDDEIEEVREHLTTKQRKSIGG